MSWGYFIDKDPIIPDANHTIFFIAGKIMEEIWDTWYIRIFTRTVKRDLYAEYTANRNFGIKNLVNYGPVFTHNEEICIVEFLHGLFLREGFPYQIFASK